MKNKCSCKSCVAFSKDDVGWWWKQNPENPSLTLVGWPGRTAYCPDCGDKLIFKKDKPKVFSRKAMSKREKKYRRLLSLGFNPASKTGNASGIHPPKKGKGYKYSRKNKGKIDECE